MCLSHLIRTESYRLAYFPFIITIYRAIRPPVITPEATVGVNMAPAPQAVEMIKYINRPLRCLLNCFFMSAYPPPFSHIIGAHKVTNALQNPIAAPIAIIHMTFILNTSIDAAMTTSPTTHVQQAKAQQLHDAIMLQTSVIRPNIGANAHIMGSSTFALNTEHQAVNILPTS